MVPMQQCVYKMLYCGALCWSIHITAVIFCSDLFNQHPLKNGFLKYMDLFHAKAQTSINTNPQEIKRSNKYSKN